MNQKSSHLLGKLIALAVFILLGITACAPAVADAANIPLAAAALNHAEVASFENRLARIELNGTLEQIGEQSAVVDGQTFRLDEQSVVVSALKPGDRVQVKAVLLPDNSLYAQSVKLDLSASSNSSFKFYGFVESMQSEVWQISSTFVQVNSSTVISGGIQTGSFVEVEGRVLNGQLVADKIQLEGDDTHKATITPGMPAGEVEFYGKIQSIQNGVYVIDGRTVRTTAQTKIKGMLAVGMMVKVHAALQNDGSYLAREIELTSGDDIYDDDNDGKSDDDKHNDGKSDDDKHDDGKSDDDNDGKSDDDNHDDGNDDDDKGDDDDNKKGKDK